MKNRLLERFLRYVAVDTRSDPASESCPSTPGQAHFLRMLAGELRELGAEDVTMDGFGYVTATLPTTKGCENDAVVAFLAHVDTSPDEPGADVRPQVIENYDGGDIRLGELTMRAADYPELALCKGHTLVTTDGRTLLGADDKAGVAVIVTAAEELLRNPSRRHGAVRVAFTPDEEIGRGVDRFDVAAFGADYGYTVDGGAEGELEYENFNAAVARIVVTGRNMHPGTAKGRMINALLVAHEFVAMLPPDERPETTEGREGFFHLTELRGDVGRAELEYILRDHCAERFEARKELLAQIAGRINERYGPQTVALTVKDQYLNMRPVVEKRPEVIARAQRAMRQAGVTPVIKPIRGGTDGARLSHMGLPCPNIFTGGANFHSRYEYCSLDTMARAVGTVLNIASETSDYQSIVGFPTEAR
ncbi:MAG: peptidase T [Rikenellaceae bacterium]|jgi:tripeptide aminopeptidase|nr:peptidase T [Rikenellaceae bacterium]